MYPRVKINLLKIKSNTQALVELCNSFNILVTGVTKVFAADTKVTESLISGGINILADSRIQNLKKLQYFNLKKALLRIPMQSEVLDVVKYSDISFNSNIETVKKLNLAAKEINKSHKIILMIDLGDLREGVMFDNKEYISNFVKTVIKSEFLDFEGIGANLACFGGVMVSEKNMESLVNIAKSISTEFNIDIHTISGGNSASIHFLNTLPTEINNLRLGESIVLGRETAFGKIIKNTYSDALQLETEIIELFNKPSVPIGKISMNAFGEIPEFKDKGIIKHGLLAIGKQDINPDSIFPINNDVKIIGASSDHLVIEIKKTDYKVGDILKFSLNYESVLRTMTSNYIEKEYI
jgi:ornithine racemase